MGTNLRKAGIHITEDNLRSLIRQYFGDPEMDAAWEEANSLTDFIMIEGKKLSLEKRSINITNQTVAKKVLNKVTNDKTDIMLLSNLIFSTRKQLKHKGIKPIDNNSSDWTSLKKLTPVVNNFCNDFELSKREGYIAYVKIGLTRITSFRGYLNKLYDMSETISIQYEAEMVIQSDVNKTLTRDIHDYYISIIIKRTGVTESYADKPNKYIKFVEVAQLVKDNNLDYKIFIDAQFEGLDWTGNYPEPEQLASDKCMERLNKYMYSSKGKEMTKKLSNIPDNKLTNILKNIRNGKDSN